MAILFGITQQQNVIIGLGPIISASVVIIGLDPIISPSTVIIGLDPIISLVVLDPRVKPEDDESLVKFGNDVRAYRHYRT